MQVTNFILCDDIRSEIGDKFSFMGVWNEKVKISNRAANGHLSAPIAMFVEVRFEPNDKRPRKFRLSVTQGETVIVKGEADIPADAPRYFRFVGSIPRLEVPAAGVVVFTLALVAEDDSRIVDCVRSIELEAA